MRFQGLAVVLGEMRWPELIARQRKNDFGLDAYAPASETLEKRGKGLAASITPTLKKLSADAKIAKDNFPDLETLLFVTAGKVSNAERKKWEEDIQKHYGLELHIIEREEIIAQMMMPENASLCASFLHLDIASEPQVTDIIERARRASAAMTQNWALKTRGHPLIDLTAVRIDPNDTESPEVFTLEMIDQVLSRGGRIVLEGPAGRGKTTTLIQLAQRVRTAGILFMIDLPAWSSSRDGILQYVARMPAFQVEGLTVAELARAQHTEPFLMLLNGWNEITESNSVQADGALRELERDFPSAGIIVATRAHHVTPPLPDALRLRLPRLNPSQRKAYLAARLGAKGTNLLDRIEFDPSLDELTLTPFILSEVASLFEAGTELPSTKIGVLDQVIRLQERRDEHSNALQSSPIFGRQEDYMKALAAEMTRRGAVRLLESDARAIVADVGRQLVNSGQIEPKGAPQILATLTARHVLERDDYPHMAFRFEHQQLQEYYAALDVQARLIELRDDHDVTDRFKSDYVNDPAWAEPLRMIAATFAGQNTDERDARSGAKLVEMALAVDLIFAGEIARLCGSSVWSEVRAVVGDRFRAVHAVLDGSFRRYALAAMLATGADDFNDLIVPLLANRDQQKRLRTYRLWPDIRVSSLGSNWRELVRGWSDEVRADFVSELLRRRIDREVAAVAVRDGSIAVKRAAATGLMWSRSDDALTRVLESMDEQTFEDVALKNANLMPSALRSRTVAAMRRFVANSTDQLARLRTALNLVVFGESGLDDVFKNLMGGLPGGDIRSLSPRDIQPTLEHLRNTDPAFASEWVAVQISEGFLSDYDYWLPFAPTIPDHLIERNLTRIETEKIEDVARCEGMTSVIAAGADAAIAERVFARERELRRRVDAEPNQQHEFDWQVIDQLEAAFRRLPDHVAAAGIIASVTRGDALDIKVASSLLSRVLRPEVEPVRLVDDDLKAQLRAYLKESVDLVLQQEDFDGVEKANLASSIAQVGEPEDSVDLVALIRADIERKRRGWAAHVAGDQGPRANGCISSYAHWHIAAIVHLDPVGADHVLIDLLREPEYRTDAAKAIARDYLRKPERPFDTTLRYDLMWAAREGRATPTTNDERRKRFSAALKSEIIRLRERGEDKRPAAGLRELAKALATLDGRDSTAAVLDVIAMPGQGDEYDRLDAAERLLIAGVVLPTSAVCALVDSIFERTKWMQDSDRQLVRRTLALCSFVDDPAAGIAKVSEALRTKRIRRYELRELVTALGESRSDAALDLLHELASDSQTFDQCEESLLNAFAAFGTRRARELLLGFVDPDIGGISLTGRPRFEDVLVARLAELAQRSPATAARLRQLCEHDLPQLNRHLLSRVMEWIGTPETLAANLYLLDDANPVPIPEGTWNQLESAFVERRPYGQHPHVFTRHARTSNKLRVRLFWMALQDPKRQESAFMILGKIEEWRLEHGRPAGEPRHPDLASGQSWPPAEPSRR